MKSVINRIWKATCAPHWLSYQNARRNILNAQNKILDKIINKNTNTRFGINHSFSTIKSIDEFRTQVSLSTYDDYIQDIKDIGSGQTAVLTKEPVCLFEPTSGSTTATKLIPYPKGLKRDFQRGIGPWIYDLFSNRPDLMNGSAYWSVSPSLIINNSLAGNIPVSFENDTSYLGVFNDRLLSRIMAVPNEIKHVKNIQSFQYVSLLFLLSKMDLKLISVWNPTFLTILFDRMYEWWDSLISDMKIGQINPPVEIAPHIKIVLEKKLYFNQSRIEELSTLGRIDITAIWPNLSLVSCWIDGPASIFADSLKKNYLPNVEIQGKGLLATEGFVSFPLWGQEGSALSINSHFFEFLPVDSNDKTMLAHELELDGQYEVVITTSGGFYRYQLHDQIQVVGFDHQVPMMRFMGKADSVSDLFGEKLSEGFVNEIVQRFLKFYHLNATFTMIAPEQENDQYRYILFMDEIPSDPYKIRELELDLDKQLRCNYHYDYCRNLGQLNNAKIRLVPADAAKRVLENDRRGMKLGNIKPAILRSTTGWADVLNGRNMS